MPSRVRKVQPAESKLTLTSPPGTDEGRRILDRALTSDPETGVLQLSGNRCMIVRPEVLVNIQKQLESTIGSSAKGVMYLAGERSSHIGLTSVDATSRGPLTLKNAQRVIDSSALMGWGRTQIIRFDMESSRFGLRIRNSPIAVAYGSSTKPVCHFIAGWAAGVACAILGRDILCEETGCVAQGHEHCEFDLHPTHSP